MTVPAPLIEFFQQEAAEYLERLDQLLEGASGVSAGGVGGPGGASTASGFPDGASFVAQARALRGSAMMTRLDGLAELCATVERIANGVKSGELRWDQRLKFAVHGALVEIRALVARAPSWGEAEQRRSRTQSVALAAVAAGYLAAGPLPSMSPASAVVPVSRLLMEDGEPAVVYRNPAPAITIAQRFRGDIAAAAGGVAREAASLATTAPGGAQLAVGDGVRRALLGLADAADSYGATSISGLATRMARSGLEQVEVRTAVQSFAQLLMDREVTDQELAAQVRSSASAWGHSFGTPVAGVRAAGSGTPARAGTPGAGRSGALGTKVGATVGGGTPAAEATPAPATPAPTAARRFPTPPYVPAAASPAVSPMTASTDIVPVETLVYSPRRALEAALSVRDRLADALRNEHSVNNDTRALINELSDLLDLAAGNPATGKPRRYSHSAP